MVQLVQETLAMNLRIEIPKHLDEILATRAAESGKDVESFVVDSLCEQLSVVPCKVSDSTTDFNLWLIDVQKSIPVDSLDIDDSRESMYAGCGE